MASSSGPCDLPIDMALGVATAGKDEWNNNQAILGLDGMVIFAHIAVICAKVRCAFPLGQKIHMLTQIHT